MPSRRSFLRGALVGFVAVAAPPLSAAPLPQLWGDGSHDDTAALRALLQGDPVRVMADDVVVRSAGEEVMIRGGRFLMSDTVWVTKHLRLGDVEFIRAEDFPLDKALFQFSSVNVEGTLSFSRADEKQQWALVNTRRVICSN